MLNLREMQLDVVVAATGTYALDMQASSAAVLDVISTMATMTFGLGAGSGTVQLDTCTQGNSSEDQLIGVMLACVPAVHDIQISICFRVSCLVLR